MPAVRQAYQAAVPEKVRAKFAYWRGRCGSTALREYRRVFGDQRGLRLFLRSFAWPFGTLALDAPGTGRRIRLRPFSSDHLVFEQVFVHEEYAIDLPFTPRSILDAGANIGAASLALGSRFPAASILAVEPEHSNFKLLSKNARAWGNGSNITLIEGAVWHESGSLNLQDPAHGKWGFRVSAGGGGTSVPAFSIDDLARRAGVEAFDLVKIDIEGGELELFSQNTDWVDKTRAIIVEPHDRSRPGCSEAFRRAVPAERFDHVESGENLIAINRALLDA